MSDAHNTDLGPSPGAGNNLASLSAHLAEVSEKNTAQALLAMGADPNHGIDHFYNFRTPLASALEIGHREAVLAMIDHLLEKDQMPLTSYEVDSESGERERVVSLFSKLITGMRGNKGRTEKYVVDHLVGSELSVAWKREIGRAISEYEGKFDISHTHTCFEQLMDVISIAQFDNCNAWTQAMSSPGHMSILARDADSRPVLARIVRAAADDGLDVNAWQVRVRVNGNDYPISLLAAAVHYGHDELARQCLELGADIDVRMPGFLDDPGKPYTGLPLMEYAQQHPGAGTTHQVISAWRAQQAVGRVLGKIRSVSELGMP